jgi:hypothetical protein
LQGIHVRRNLPVIGKQAEGCELLLPLIENFQGLAPGRLLTVVDLAQVHHRAMHHPLTRDATALHDTEIAMLLAVLVAAMNFQVHVCWQNAGIFTAWEEGRSGLQAVWGPVLLK